MSFTADDLKTWARDIGLDANEFETCLDSGKYQGEAAKDLEDGIAAGITGTPGTFVNGKLISGSVPFSVFQKEIEAALRLTK